MKTNIIKVRFNGSLSMREYTYFTPVDVAVGDVVVIEVRQDKNVLGTVSEIDVPESAIVSFVDKMKTIVGKYVDTKINLCDTCKNDFPECDATVEDMTGDGVGNGNVIKCDCYEKKDLTKEEV